MFKWSIIYVVGYNIILIIRLNLNNYIYNKIKELYVLNIFLIMEKKYLVVLFIKKDSFVMNDYKLLVVVFILFLVLWVIWRNVELRDVYIYVLYFDVFLNLSRKIDVKCFLF